MKLSVSYDFLPKKKTTLTVEAMNCFGIDFETGKQIIAEDFELPIESGTVVCFTGESGSGKSSLMKKASEQCSETLCIDQLQLEEKPLVESLGNNLEESMKILSACGLSEAQLMLRTPAELSDGQRYRFRLALGISKNPQWIIADEFTATLDRTLAKVVAFNLRKLCDRTKIGFFIATTHEDILGDLCPDLHIQCELNAAPRSCFFRKENDQKNRTGQRVKKKSASPMNSGSLKRPDPTGRTSLGGITDQNHLGS